MRMYFSYFIHFFIKNFIYYGKGSILNTSNNSKSSISHKMYKGKM